MASKHGKNYALSESAADAFEEFRSQLYAMQKLEPNPPSASVSVEFLVWWFYETRTLEGHPSPSKFEPKTRRGRQPTGAEAQLLAPSRIREGLGLDPVVQRRKL